MDWSTKFNQFFGALSVEKWQALLMQGLWNTVKIAVLGLIIGILVGTIIAIIGAAPKNKWPLKVLDKICAVYVALFRGTPMVVQLLVAYYVLLPAIGVVGVDSVTVGIIVFGLNSGAYVSEIMRGGLNSVDVGQMEAGRSLGMSYSQTMIRIVIPQAIKNILPTLGNEFITLIKETSVLSMISVYDLYCAVVAIGAPFYDKVMPFLFMAIIYIGLVLLITLLIKLLERALGKSDRRTSLVKKRKLFSIRKGA